jgi:methionine-rich copper-binding protein CopC
MSYRLAVLAFAALAVAGTAQAHAQLVAASPAANAAVSAPGKVELTFSEKLEPKFSSAKLSSAAGPVAVKSAASGKVIVATPGKPLSAGLYTVDWQILSADGHKVTGAYKFTVN